MISLRRWHPTLAGTVLVTLPVVALVVYAWLSGVRAAYNAHEFQDWWADPKDVRKEVGYEAREWAHVVEATGLIHSMDLDRADPGIIRLDVKRSDWDTLLTDPQTAFGHFYKATLVRGARREEVGLRVRGDSSVHFTTPKPSFTLRTSKTDLFRGHRDLAFSCKDVLCEFTTARVAAHFDLLATQTELAAVVLNREFYGLYRVIEPPSEAFLRRVGRLPGNLFRGDTAMRGEIFKGMPALIYNPYEWERLVKDTRSDAAARQTLTRMLTDWHGTTLEHRLRLREKFDLAEISRVLAMMMVTGDSYHMSNIHNQFWYEDPSTRVLHPIPWDTYVRTLLPARPQALQVSAPYKAFLRDPEVMDAAFRYIYAQMNEHDLRGWIHRLIWDNYHRYREFFGYDELRVGAIAAVAQPAETNAMYQSNLNRVVMLTAQGETVYHAEPMDGGFVVDIETQGSVGCNLTGFVVMFGSDGAAARGTETAAVPVVTVTADTSRTGRPDTRNRAIAATWQPRDSGGHISLTAAEPLLAGVDTTVEPFAPAPLNYRFFVRVAGAGVPATARLVPELRHRVLGGPVVPVDAKAGRPAASSTAWHPWDLPAKPAGRAIALSGSVTLSENLVVGVADTLTIAPGTAVRLGPGVSIAIRGRATVEGTEQQPITFVADHADQPWGCIAVLGAQAAGSTFTHCAFAGGDGASIDDIDCTGMVDVKRAPACAFNHCDFRKTARASEALRVTLAQATITSCHFRDTRADALHLELAERSVVRGCTFDAIGRTCIDVIASDPLILDSTMTGAKGCGMAAGASSTPFLFNNRFVRCGRGVEATGGGTPTVVECSFQDCHVGVRQRAASKTNNDGGLVRLVACSVVGNRVDVESDARARLVNVGSQIGAAATETRTADAATTVVRDRLLAERGIRVNRTVPGAGGSLTWEPAKPDAPVVSWTFTEDFNSVNDGWKATDRISRADKQGHDLVLHRLHDVGGMSRDVSRDIAWDLQAASRHYVALVEVDTQALREAVIEFRHADGAVVFPLDVNLPPGRCALVPVDLPPARYLSVTVRARAAPPAAVLSAVGGKKVAKPSVPKVAATPTEDAPPVDPILQPGKSAWLQAEDKASVLLHAIRVFAVPNGS